MSKSTSKNNLDSLSRLTNSDIERIASNPLSTSDLEAKLHDAIAFLNTSNQNPQLLETLRTKLSTLREAAANPRQSQESSTNSAAVAKKAETTKESPDDEMAAFIRGFMIRQKKLQQKIILLSNTGKLKALGKNGKPIVITKPEDLEEVTGFAGEEALEIAEEIIAQTKELEKVGVKTTSQTITINQNQGTKKTANPTSTFAKILITIAPQINKEHPTYGLTVKEEQLQEYAKQYKIRKERERRAIEEQGQDRGQEQYLGQDRDQKSYQAPGHGSHPDQLPHQDQELEKDSHNNYTSNLDSTSFEMEAEEKKKEKTQKGNIDQGQNQDQGSYYQAKESYQAPGSYQVQESYQTPRSYQAQEPYQAQESYYDQIQYQKPKEEFQTSNVCIRTFAQDEKIQKIAIARALIIEQILSRVPFKDLSDNLDNNLNTNTISESLYLYSNEQFSDYTKGLNDRVGEISSQIKLNYLISNGLPRKNEYTRDFEPDSDKPNYRDSGRDLDRDHYSSHDRDGRDGYRSSEDWRKRSYDSYDHNRSHGSSHDRDRDDDYYRRDGRDSYGRDGYRSGDNWEKRSYGSSYDRDRSYSSSHDRDRDDDYYRRDGRDSYGRDGYRNSDNWKKRSYGTSYSDRLEDDYYRYGRDSYRSSENWKTRSYGTAYSDRLEDDYHRRDGRDSYGRDSGRSSENWYRDRYSSRDHDGRDDNHGRSFTDDYPPSHNYTDRGKSGGGKGNGR